MGTGRIRPVGRIGIAVIKSDKDATIIRQVGVGWSGASRVQFIVHLVIVAMVNWVGECNTVGLVDSTNSNVCHCVGLVLWLQSGAIRSMWKYPTTMSRSRVWQLALVLCNFLEGGVSW